MADLLIWKLNNKAHEEHLDTETNDYNQHTESTKNDSKFSFKLGDDRQTLLVIFFTYLLVIIVIII